MTERKPPTEAWDSFVERQIREAQQSGEFDRLPGFGKPLAEADEPSDDMWWIREKLRRERLSVLPPALSIRLDVQRTLHAAWKLDSELAVRRVIEALNERIRQANFAAVWGPPCTTMPLDIDNIVGRWRAHQRER